MSWIGFAFGIIGLWAAPRYRHGWFIAAFASGPWILYALSIHSWALVATSIVYGSIDLINYWKVLHDDSFIRRAKSYRKA